MLFKPRLAITMGDPAGIGPEVIVKALSQPKAAAGIRPVLIGEIEAFKRAAAVCRSHMQFLPVAACEPAPVKPGVLPVIPITGGGPRVFPGKWNRHTGAVSLAAVKLAAELALAGQVDGIVTAPICKEAWHAAGEKSPGHTEYLARLAKTQEYAMVFVGGPFRLVLATIHVALARVPRLLTAERIVRAALVGARELQHRFNLARPKIAVAGFNPHASEGGLFGDEEARVIMPAIKILARHRDLKVAGPFAPDTLFAQAVQGTWDLIVCMYHDQGLIPFKLLALHSGVNVTAGLPIIRTSPDHGTAFDLAGTGQADPGSMAAAIRVAADMAKNERKTTWQNRG